MGIQAYTTDRRSDEFLEVNSCGIEFISAYDRGSERVNGRSDYHILYVEKGVCHVLLDGVWQSVGEGGVILYRPGEPQVYRYLKEDESISHYVHFTGAGCEKLLMRLGIDGVRVFMMGRSRSYEELSEKLAYEYSMRRPCYEDWCSAYLWELLSIVGRKYTLRRGSVNPHAESRINVACRRIYGQLSSPPSVELLAKESCLSVSRFSHLFREVTGKSVSEFTNGLRMDRAGELLSGTDMSVREVAETIGFENQNYFSRCFRKEMGMSPREYRQRQQATQPQVETS